ncbi:MAG: hypothetical protein ABSA59_12990 [Terriglobia bacterium]|jgi:hypothetical protein
MDKTAYPILVAKRILRELSTLSERVHTGFLGVQKQIESIAKEQQAKNKREQCYPPLVRAEVQVPPAIQDKKEASKARNERRERIKVLIEAATFVAILGYALLVYFQWKEMIAATDAATTALEESRKNRQQAEKSLMATIEQFHLDQRAWVGITDISIKNVVSPGHRFVWIGYVQNSGKTPSLNTVMLFKYRTFLKNEPPSFVYDEPTKEPRGKMSLMPSMKISIGGHENLEDTPLTEPQVRAMQEGVTQMYVFGKIEYDDVFKIPHCTHVCAWVDRDLSTTHPCQAYNDAN